jgi:hypothetical protein
MSTKTEARIRKKTSTKPMLDELPSDSAELVILSRKRIDNDAKVGLTISELPNDSLR